MAQAKCAAHLELGGVSRGRSTIHHLGRSGGQRHYDHSSTLKTLEEIFSVKPLLGAAADPRTNDLSDLFRGENGNEN